MVDNVVNITSDTNSEVLTIGDFEDAPFGKSLEVVKPLELKTVESEEEIDNPCDILAQYIHDEISEYQCKIVKPQDVQFMYNRMVEERNGFSGKRTTLSPAIFLKIIELRELYNFPEMRICAAIGLHISNLRKWKRMGSYAPGSPNHEPYFSLFVWAYEKAGSYIEKSCLTNIKEAGQTKWEASKWLLSKLHQDRYGDRMEVESGINNGHGKDVNLTVNLNLGDLKLVSNDLESFIEHPIEIDNE